jgi:hypothetical protein
MPDGPILAAPSPPSPPFPPYPPYAPFPPYPPYPPVVLQCSHGHCGCGGGGHGWHGQSGVQFIPGPPAGVPATPGDIHAATPVGPVPGAAQPGAAQPGAAQPGGGGFNPLDPLGSLAHLFGLPAPPDPVTGLLGALFGRR